MSEEPKDYAAEFLRLTQADMDDMARIRRQREARGSLLEAVIYAIGMVAFVVCVCSVL